MHRTRLAALAIALALPATAGAVESGLHLQLGGSGDFERRVMTYDCGAEAPVTVTYLNAAPNFLALVPIEGESEPVLFVSVLSASGARYASGQWVWWSDGAEASLFDETAGEDAPAVLECSEINNIP